MHSRCAKRLVQLLILRPMLSPAIHQVSQCLIVHRMWHMQPPPNQRGIVPRESRRLHDVHEGTPRPMPRFPSKACYNPRHPTEEKRMDALPVQRRGMYFEEFEVGAVGLTHARLGDACGCGA